MRISNKGIELIKSFESLHDGDLSKVGLQPKMCPSLIWTEGYGKAMRKKDGSFMKGIKDKDLAYSNISIHTEKEADDSLKIDIQTYERIVMSKIKIDLNNNQFDALVSYTYNTGGSDTLFKLINQKAPEEQIKKWFETKYITANGVVMRGLVNRRKAESNLYFS